eukprot:3326-Rhodomonas_salina.1
MGSESFKFKLGQGRLASTQLVLTGYISDSRRTVDSSSSLCPSVDTPGQSTPPSLHSRHPGLSRLRLLPLHLRRHL